MPYDAIRNVWHVLKTDRQLNLPH